MEYATFMERFATGKRDGDARIRMRIVETLTSFHLYYVDVDGITNQTEVWKEDLIADYRRNWPNLSEAEIFDRWKAEFDAGAIIGTSLD